MFSFFRAKEPKTADYRQLLGDLASLTEASSSDPRLLELAIEDIGWSSLGGNRGGLELESGFRESVVRKARLYSIHDPLLVHAVRLWRDFVIGRGFEVKSPDARAQGLISSFWNARRNRSVFSHGGMRESGRRFVVDGEVAFAAFPGVGGTTVRQMEILEIESIVRNPQDAAEVWGYTRRIGYGSSEKKFFYRDMLLDPDVEIKAPEGYPEQAAVVRFMPHGRRGHSILTPAIDWSRAHREFMKSRSAIQQALARFAWKHKVKGGAGAVAAALAHHRSGYQNGTTEDNPAPAHGGVWAENASSDLSPLRIETGAASAQIDGDSLVQMTGVGVGIFPHWFGTGTSAKFSTSNQMELPMLRQFQGAQGEWVDFYRDLVTYDLSQRGVDVDTLELSIDYPEVVPRDVPGLMDAVSKGVAACPRLGKAREVESFVLTVLGIDNAEQVLDRLDAEGIIDAE